MATSMPRALDPLSVAVVELPQGPDQVSETTIEAMLRDGDRDALLPLLMERYGQAVYRFAFTMVRSSDAAEEIRQRVFVEAYRDLADFAGKSSLQAWLFGITRNRCIDECRRTNRWNERFKNEARGDVEGEHPAPDVELERRNLVAILRNCLGKLAPAAREAVTLRFLEQMSYKEIAKLIDDLPTTLQRRVARALPQLRRCLDAPGSGAGPSNARYVGSPIVRGRRPAMSCDLFWRDGVLLVESGDPDPHREECASCQAAHEDYVELVEALARVDRDVRGNQGWELRVWRQIALEARSRRRARWLIAPLSAACAVLAVWFMIGRDGGGGGGKRPRYELESVADMRSTSAHVGDHVRVFADVGNEVRVYRAGLLILGCPPGVATIGCIPDGHGLIAHAFMTTMGRYQIIVAHAPAAAWVGTLDGDRAAILASGGTYERFDLSAR